jgi:hypothetical protein
METESEALDVTGPAACAHLNDDRVVVTRDLWVALQLDRLEEERRVRRLLATLWCVNHDAGVDRKVLDDMGSVAFRARLPGGEEVHVAAVRWVAADGQRNLALLNLPQWSAPKTLRVTEVVVVNPHEIARRRAERLHRGCDA